jgi:hypothetical protein
MHEQKKKKKKCVSYKLFVMKYEGRRLLRRPRHRSGSNIEMDLREIECEGVDWIQLQTVRSSSRTVCA